MKEFSTTPNLQAPSFDIFLDDRIYIDTKRMYFGLYKKVPCLKRIEQLNHARFKDWFETQEIFKINSFFSRESYDWYNKQMKYKNIIYILNDEIIVDFFDETIIVAFSVNQYMKAQSIIDAAKKFRKRRNKITHEIQMVIPDSGGGLTTKPIKLSKPKLKVEIHYNDDLSEKHQSIIKSLNKKDESGLFLFYGEPGTGKSTYIRYLINSVKKDVIFLSPSMASNLDSPALTKLLIQKANTVFIIEDAEQLLISRERDRSSSISMLLNLTDGLLGDSLGIQIIATFNTHINNIDKALLRKGRLKTLYEFKALTVEKSKKMLELNGINNYLVTKTMTLAEIYNISQADINYTNERQSIGFLNRAV